LIQRKRKIVGAGRQKHLYTSKLIYLLFRAVYYYMTYKEVINTKKIYVPDFLELGYPISLFANYRRGEL